MTRNEVKELERKLRIFYKKDKIIHSYKKGVEKLKLDILNIEKRIKECDFNIPIQYGTSSFGEKVQSSTTGESNVEKELIKCIVRLENNKIEKLKEIERIEKIIDLIERDNLLISRNLNSLNEESIKFLELKYKYHKSGRYIAIEMNSSEPTITRLKRKILNEIYNWEDYYPLMYLNSVEEAKKVERFY